MATAAQLKEIRRKAGIGEFSKKKSTAKAPTKRPSTKPATRTRVPLELRKEERFNTASKGVFESYSP